MACCCKNILDLCSVSVCSGEVKTGQEAEQTGTYKLVVEFLGMEFTQEAEVTQGQEIKFPAQAFNEKYTYVGHVLTPAGGRLSISKEGRQYDCIRFETKISFTL